MKVTNNIRILAKAARLTLNDLAQKVGIGETYLSHIANAKHIPRVDLAVLIARELGVTVEDVFIISQLEEFQGKRKKLRRSNKN